MKTLLLILTLCFCSISVALTKTEFNALDDNAKAEFIQNQALEVYDLSALERFEGEQKPLMNLLAEKGEDLSRVWYDTILEGPYALTGDSEVSISSLYLHNGEVYAILATVSAPAVFVDSCNYDEEAEEWDEGCYAGSISESFVMDSSGELIDLGYYAEFID